MTKVNNPFSRYSSQLRQLAFFAVGIAWTLIIGGMIMGHLYPANVALNQNVVPTPPEPQDNRIQNTVTKQQTNTQEKLPIPTLSKDFTGLIDTLILHKSDLGIESDLVSRPNFYARSVSFFKGEARNILVSDSPDSNINMGGTESSEYVNIRILSVATSSIYKSFNPILNDAYGVVVEIEYMGTKYTNLLLSAGYGTDFTLETSYDVTQSNIVQIEARDALTWVIRYDNDTEQFFAIEGPARHDNFARLIPLDETANYKLFESGKDYPLAFRYPREYFLRWTGTDKANHVSPSGVDAVYFEGSCGLEPGMRDVYLSLEPDNQLEQPAIEIGLRPARGVVGITTTLYGYDPSDWGTILRKINLYDYVAGVVSGRQIPGRTVTLETIGGKKVRHILPFVLGRPCNNEYREQYQWVVDGHLITVDATYMDEYYTTPPSNEKGRKAVESIIASLVVVSK